MSKSGRGGNHRSDATTNSTTDVRRAQQRARSAVREAEGNVKQWVRNHPEALAALGGGAGAGAVGMTLSEVAAELSTIIADAFRSLVFWIRERKRLTARRAIRSSHERLSQMVVQRIDRSELIGDPNTLVRTEALLAELDARDEGMFIPSGGRGSPTTQSLADRLASEVAQQITVSARLGEPYERMGRRVSGVMTKGPGDIAERREMGISGDTALTRAERLAHDTLQSAYMASYAKNLLNNGVRYGRYVAILDDRTTELCQRLHGVMVDMVETPLLIPPNHWWCYGPETEVLTTEGFVPFPELDGSEELFTLDEERNIQREQPKRLIQRQYSGDMVHLKNNDFDVMATPNHKMAYYSDWGMKNHDSPTLQRKRIDEMSVGDRIPRTGTWDVDGPETLSIAGEEYPTGEFMEFMGWFLSEGSVSVDRGAYRLCVAQVGNKSRSAIYKLMRELFGPAEVWIGSDRVGLSSNHPVAEWLLPLGHSHEKYIPERLKSLPKENLRTFLDAYLAGDGTITEAGSSSGERWDYEFEDKRSYYTSSEELADDIGELILKCGYRPSFHTPNEGRKRTVEHENGEYRTKHPAIKVEECHNENYSHRKEYTSTEEYDGMVYCVSMPENPTIYIRRNGKCTWAGNCRSNLIPTLTLAEGEVPIAEEEVGTEYRVFINRWRSADTGNWLPIDTAVEYNPESRLSADRYDPVPTYKRGPFPPHSTERAG